MFYMQAFSKQWHRRDLFDALDKKISQDKASDTYTWEEQPDTPSTLCEWRSIEHVVFCVVTVLVAACCASTPLLANLFNKNHAHFGDAIGDICMVPFFFLAWVALIASYSLPLLEMVRYYSRKRRMMDALCAVTSNRASLRKDTPFISLSHKCNVVAWLHMRQSVFTWYRMEDRIRTQSYLRVFLVTSLGLTVAGVIGFYTSYFTWNIIVVSLAMVVFPPLICCIKDIVVLNGDQLG